MTTPSKQQSTLSPSKGAVSTPHKWPLAEHYNGIVTGVVGSEKKPYSLHKGLLCFYSDYFRAAFNGTFKEAIDGQIQLPDVEQNIFDVFQVWLYSRRLQVPDSHATCFSILGNLWIFGDKHQIPLLQNEVMDELFAKHAKLKVLNISLVHVAYQETLPGSALRKAAVEIVGHSVKLENLTDGALRPAYQLYWSIESLIDLVRVIDKARRDNTAVFPNLPKRDKCFFHVHGKDEHC